MFKIQNAALGIYPLALTVCACLATSTFAQETPQRPNIVVILADDMGSGDVQALNSKSTIPTPALNSLAAQGMTKDDSVSSV